MKKLIALFATTAVASGSAMGAIALSGTASVSYDDNGSKASATTYDADMTVTGTAGTTTLTASYDMEGGTTAASGGVTGLGGTASYTSAFVKIDPMDGLEIGFGVGETPPASSGDNSQTDDVDTAYISYVYGPLTVAYQASEVDTYTAAQTDDEQTRWGVLYAVNDEMSISYQSHENDDGTATDEEATGWSASYTVGSMTFKAHRNVGDNLTNAASNESEHTEVGVTFAF